MPSFSPPRSRLIALLAALALVATACGTDSADPAPDDPDDETTDPDDADGPDDGAESGAGEDYEVWALDQGEDINQLIVYSPDLDVIDTVDLGEIAASDDDSQLITTPHMVDFDSEGRYAFIASTNSGNVTVVRAADKEIVEIIPTAEGAHMAAVTPDDSAVWVANIAGGSFTEIEIDLDAETFELSGRELIIKDDPAYDDDLFPTEFVGPVCHDYSPDGRYAWVTLGPGTGGLAVVDLETVEIAQIWPQDDVKANCGIHITSDGQTAYANWGVPTQDEGELYVFDAQELELLETIPTNGIDAHGVRLTPDESELWLVNRDSSNGIVLDTATNEISRELTDDNVGTVPDILDFSPDGDRAFITLRGPEPMSGAHATIGETPGVAVVDVASGDLIEVLEPNEGNDRSDFHGIAVRPSADTEVTAAGAPREWTSAVTRAPVDGLALVCHLPV